MEQPSQPFGKGRSHELGIALKYFERVGHGGIVRVHLIFGGTSIVVVDKANISRTVLV